MGSNVAGDRSKPSEREPQWTITVTDGQAIQIGDHNTQNNYWPTSWHEASAGKRELLFRVRDLESSARAHLLGLDIIRPIGATQTYLVEHTARFQAVGAENGRVRNDIMEFFTGQAARRLVVLGPAGAGKSVMATEIVLGLLRSCGPDDPVPVRFDLANWSPTTALTEWVVTQLVTGYEVPVDEAEALVHRRDILPIFDGLDEVSVERVDLRRAIAALNEFLAPRYDAGFVVTCRNDVYLDVGRTIEPAVEITLLPLVPEEIIGFIEGVAGNDSVAWAAWQPVLQALAAGNDAVIAALNTPWRLTLALTFHLDRGNTHELVPIPPESTAEYSERVRGLLIGTFAPTRARLRKLETKERTEAWCAVIAEDLDAQVARGEPANDILTHYSADRQWGTELLNRATAAMWLYIGSLLFLGVPLLICGVVDALAGTRLIGDLTSALRSVAGAWMAWPTAVAAGLALWWCVRRGVPRAGPSTRRQVRNAEYALTSRLWVAVVRALGAIGNFFLGGLLFVLFVGVVAFLITAPVVGVGAAVGLAALIALVPAIPGGLGSALQATTKYDFEIWQGVLRSPGVDQGWWSAHQKGLSANWTVPSADLERILGSPDVSRNWPAAAESFLVKGYSAGIFRRSGEVYQFRHRQLREWYAHPVHALRAWDNQLPLDSGERGIKLVHQVSSVYHREARAAAQRILIRRDYRRRAEQQRAAAARAGRLLRPPGVIARCDLGVVRALVAAEVEARDAGAAVIQPWHVVMALFVEISDKDASCPAPIEQMREVLRPLRTISRDESPSHLPLSAGVCTVLIAATGRWSGRLRPEHLAHDLLNADDDDAQRTIEALRHPFDSEQLVRSWLTERISRIRSGEVPADAGELRELAGILLAQLDRPDEAEKAVREAVELELKRGDRPCHE